MSFASISSIKTVFQDARHFQILFLGSFLLFACVRLGWEQEVHSYLAIIISCLATQFFFIKKLGLSMQGLKSGMITALGLCLLLKSGSIYSLILASIIAISSKFLLRFKGKHIFNPGNFGIVLAVLLSGDAWISPGQWGTDTVLVWFFSAAALMVLLKVGRMETSITFLVVLTLAEVLRSVVYQGWGMDVVAHKLVNGSILLYAFFMITDPKTTPNSAKARILWAAMVALISFFISNWAYVHTAPIWALFAVSMLTPVFDRVWKGKAFQWLPQKNPNSQTLNLKT